MYTSLYVHIPFCVRKCAYCAFHSVAGASHELRRAWLRKISREFTAGSPHCQTLRSIFIGGGTPTVLSPATLGALFSDLHRNFPIAPDCEWTIEANPGSLSPGHIEVLAQAGVNRVSIGIQSFQPSLCQTLGRHSETTNLGNNIRQLQAAGIKRLNLDLIYAIPGQTRKHWCDDLRRAGDLGAEHVSAYALTIEEGTRLAANHPTLPTDSDFEEFWHLSDSILAEYGIRRYEISNFSRPGSECRHNLAIWYGSTYLGCGPTATSFDGRNRRTNPELSPWLADEEAETDRLSPADRAAEILAFGFRTVAGWDLAEFQRKTGFDARKLRGRQLQELENDKLLESRAGHLCPTTRGLLLNDTIISQLL